MYSSNISENVEMLKEEPLQFWCKPTAVPKDYYQQREYFGQNFLLIADAL